MSVRSDAGSECIRLLCVGGEDHNLRIAFMLALRERGIQVSAAGTGDPAPFARAGLTYHRFRFDRFLDPLGDRTAVGKLRELFAQTRPDIVQSFDTKPNMLVPLAARTMRDVAVVRTINGLGWVYSSRSPLARSLRPVQRVMYRLAAASTAATVFQNRDDKAFFERHRMLGRGRNHLIPGSGIDIGKFEQAAAGGPSDAALRDELGLATAEVVLTVTRLNRQKGIPTLLKAAALVHRVRPNVRFLLVGPRESEGRLAVSQAEIERHAPYVQAIGQRADVPALLGLADAFVFPTEYREGVPRALLEAALAGLPIVTTSMPGCTDVVRNGWSGFLVPPRSPREIAVRVLDLLQQRQLAREMGQRAAALVRQEFGLRLVVDRYCSLYAQLTDRASGVTCEDLE